MATTDAVGRVALPAATATALVRRGKLETVADVLQLSATELQARTGLTAAEAAAAVVAVSAHVYPPSRGETASVLYARATADTASAGAAGALARLSLGDFALDSFLRGGLVVPGLTELSGESATGKTQLCLQLCLAVQLPPAFGGLGAGALYISTEDTFPSGRLQHMLAGFQARYDFMDRGTLTDKILLQQIGDSDSLDVLLNAHLPTLLATKSVRLVVIDSLAALFRGAAEATTAAARAAKLTRMAATMKRLSDAHSAVFLCVNQVTDRTVSDGSFLPDVILPRGQRLGATPLVPTLGLAWANCVSLRLMLSRTDLPSSNSELPAAGAGRAADDPANPAATTERRLYVLMAPHLPHASQRFCITADGVVGVADP